MDTNFRFASLVGSVYKNGNVLFSPDGYSVFSPVGNKVSIFDLKNNTSRTLELDCEFSITAMSLSSNGSHLIVVDEAGNVMYVNMATETVIHKMRPAMGKVPHALAFSPNRKYIACLPDTDLQIHEVGSMEQNMFRPFHLVQTIRVAAEPLTTIDWSDDSRLTVVGCEDKVARVVPAIRGRWIGVKPFKALPLGANWGRIVMAAFFKNSYDVVTVDHRGQANVFDASILPSELEIEEGVNSQTEDVKKEELEFMEFTKTHKAKLQDVAGSSFDTDVDVTAAAFQKDTNLLVTGFSNGVFVLHELPTFSLVHNLRLSDVRISTLAINRTGDWLAVGCGKGTTAQLIVWEWQSETYVMKQQSHSERVLSTKFSPDGSLIATGAEDGKVKIWSVRNGFCTVTFDEHTSGVSSVAWTQSGKAILSASLDGTVRARDLKRYRNFRTLVCPEPTQLGALAVDSSGDIVVAAAKEVFNVFIWSMENGRLLDVLSAHTSIVADVSLHGNSLATCSWDKTFKVWNITDSTSESTDMVCECLAVEWSPCGGLLAVLTMDSVITFFTKANQQIGTIDAALDIDAGRSQYEQIRRETSEKNKTLTSLCFSPDGQLLLVGGDFNYVCLYSVADRLLVKKFRVTQNKSLDGVMLDINRRNMSDFGDMRLMDDSDSETEGGYKREIKLAGTRHSDVGERSAKPVIAVYDVSFCPTGRRLAVCSTEGVGVYSLDTVSFFDPFHLDSSTSPETVLKLLSLADYSNALMAALRLNESKLIAKCCESIPLVQVDLVAKSIPLLYAERLLKWIADGDVVWTSPHIHFYMRLVFAVLNVHGVNAKGRTDTSILTGVQQIVTHHKKLIEKLADHNKFGLKYLCEARKLKRPAAVGGEKSEKMDTSA